MMVTFCQIFMNFRMQFGLENWIWAYVIVAETPPPVGYDATVDD